MAAIPKDSASFVFQGKVTKTKSSNVKAVARSNRTAVVTIENVVRAPGALASFSGRDVTVQLAQDEDVKQGQRATFYTNGSVFGENLAVQSVGHEAVKSTSSGARGAARPVTDAARAAAQKRIRDHAAAAPVVISGRVVAVGMPAGAAPAAAASSAGTSPRRVSEHEPFWREAVVEVQQVHKGTVSKKQVVLRFPDSTDVRWHRAPKFEVGQEGVFSLKPDRVSGHTTHGAMASSFNTEDSYTCLSAADFQDSHNEAEAAAAIDAAKN